MDYYHTPYIPRSWIVQPPTVINQLHMVGQSKLSWQVGLWVAYPETVDRVPSAMDEPVPRSIEMGSIEEAD